jgi:hypothetical protein
MSSMVFMLRLSIGSIEQECQTFRVRLEIQRPFSASDYQGTRPVYRTVRILFSYS